MHELFIISSSSFNIFARYYYYLGSNSVILRLTHSGRESQGFTELCTINEKYLIDIFKNHKEIKKPFFLVYDF